MPTQSPPSPLTSRALRRLFFTLFLRGRGSRGLSKNTVPKSIPRKLAGTLLIYSLFGLIALPFIHQPLFPLAIYLHALTFAFLGVFVASSSGEILFNTQEADILLHRPIHPSTLLWAKIHVLVVVSLYIAAAMNLVGTFIGCFTSDGGWRFPLAHALSTTLEALFCTGAVIMAYQLCLRWFGRERLDGLMTTAQVLVAIGAMLVGQVMPRLMMAHGNMNNAQFAPLKSWWILLLPPAWFAGLDDLLAANGYSSPLAWTLSALAIVATLLVLVLVFHKLAQDYESGLQTLAENTPRPKKSRTTRRLLDRLIALPPLSWWLRNPVERASFLLTAAYIARDRDTKLRLYPGLAPTLIFPVIMIADSWRTTTAPGHAPGTGFQLGFTSAFLGLLPLMALNILQYSQQWQAADLFRTAPIAGPAPICNGARRAVHCLITFPMMLLLLVAVAFIARSLDDLLMLCTGIVSFPVFSLLPHIRGTSVPFSVPTEEAKSANRGLTMILSLLAAMSLAALATAARYLQILPWFLLVELLFCTALYFLLRLLLNQTSWPITE